MAIVWSKEHTHETFSLRSEESSLAQDDAVDAAGEEFTGGDYLEFLVAGDSDTDDNRDSQAQFDVFLDDFPTAGFHGELVG